MSKIFDLILNDKEKISIEIPENWQVMQKILPSYYRPKRFIPDVIKSSLNNPTGTEKLESLLKNKKNVVIISDDQTRPTPVDQIIPILVEKLQDCGISDIKIVVGRGLHPAPNEIEISRKFKDLPDEFPFFIHDPDQNCSLLGNTSSKVPVEVNDVVSNADFRISLGTIQPHELTGFTGGAAIIVPGVASRKTIRLNHSLLFKVQDQSFFGNIENPVRFDMEEAARLAKLDFIVNVIMDNYGQIFEVFSGDFKEVHERGADSFKHYYGVKLQEKEKADICIISAYPRYETIGKGLKALFIGDLVTKNNGNIICYISGDKGISSSEVFEELLLKNLKVAELLALLKKGELPGEACVLYLFTMIKRKKIIIITKSHFKDKIKQMGLLFAKNFEDAVKLVDDGSTKTVNLVPEGINLLPILE